MRTLTPGARLEWQEGLAGPPVGVKGASPKSQHQETQEKAECFPGSRTPQGHTRKGGGAIEQSSGMLCLFVLFEGFLEVLKM